MAVAHDDALDCLFGHPLEEIHESAPVDESSSNQSSNNGDSTDLFSGLTEESFDLSLDENLEEDLDLNQEELVLDSVISLAEQENIIEAFDELNSYGSLLEKHDQFDEPLAFVEGETLGSLTGFYEIFDTRLKTPVYDYFNNSVDPPTISGLISALQQNTENADNLAIYYNSIVGGYAPENNNLQFSIDLTATRSGLLTLGPEALQIAENPTPDVDALVDFVATLDFTFTIEIDFGDAAGFNIFFDKFDVNLDINLPVNSQNSNLIFSQVRLSGKLDFDTGTVFRSAHIIPFDFSILTSSEVDTSPDNIKLNQQIVSLFQDFDSITVGDQNSNNVVEVVSSDSPLTFNTPLTISNPESGGEVWIRNDLLGGINSSLTIFGSGHTTHIGDGAEPYSGLTISQAGDINIVDSVVLHGNVLLESTGGNITISGTVQAAAGGPYTLTVRAAGTVLFMDDIGGAGNLQNLTVETATAIFLDRAVSVTGAVSLNASNTITISGDVSAPLGFSSTSVLFTSSAPITTFENTIEIDTVSNTSGAFIQAPLFSNGGNIFIDSSNEIVSTLGGEINSSGPNGSPGGDAGEIYIYAFRSLTLSGAVNANGGNGLLEGDNGGSGGLITIRNTFDQLLLGGIVSAIGGTGGDNAVPGSKGVIQLKTKEGSISQHPASQLLAGKLKLIGSSITLNNLGNNVEILAAEINNGTNLTYRDADHLIIASVSETGIANLPSKLGIVASGGDGSITIISENGSLVVDENIIAAGTGQISLQAKGTAKDIVVRAAVLASTGDILLQATGFVAYTGQGSVETNPPGSISVTADGQIPDSQNIQLYGDFAWDSQGPEMTTGGQVMGMDYLGNPVSGAIQSILIHPDTYLDVPGPNANVAFVGTVDGGLWRTNDITATRWVEPYTPTKAAALDFSKSAVTSNTNAAGQLNSERRYLYKITYVDSTGAESNASRYVFVDLSAGQNQVQFADLPIGPADTVERRIYRTRPLQQHPVTGEWVEDPTTIATSPLFYFHETISNNTDTNYIDNQADILVVTAREIEVPFPIWEPLTDEYPSLAVGALAFDADDPNIIYVGTGSASSSNRGGLSIGILKSSDGGSTFQKLATDEFFGVKIQDIISSNFDVSASVVPYLTQTGGLAHYDSVHHRLTIYYESGVTTASDVVAAVAALGADSKVTAQLFQQSNDGSGVIDAATTFDNVTIGGSPSSAAVGAIFPSGDNTAILFTSTVNSSVFNNLKVVITGGAEFGSEEASYDGSTNTLTIRIAVGVSPTNSIIAAVDAEGTFDAQLAVNSGVGTYYPGSFKGVLSDGNVASAANLVINPLGTDNAVIFTASENGANHDGIEILFADKINQVVVGTYHYLSSKKGGLYISNDGGYYWTKISGSASFPHGTVTDLLLVPDDTSLADPNLTYLAAVVGPGPQGEGNGAYLDANTIEYEHKSDEQSLTISLGTIEMDKWSALTNTRSFVMSLGDQRKTITPDFSNVDALIDNDGTHPNNLEAVLQGAVDTAFGALAVIVEVQDTSIRFVNYLMDNTNRFLQIGSLEDPDHGGSLLGPNSPGIYRSVDYGLTWTQVTGPAVGEMDNFRRAGRVELTAHIPDAGVPILYAATLNGLRSPDTFDGKLNGIFMSSDLGDTWQYIMDTPRSMELNGSLLNDAFATITVAAANQADMIDHLKWQTYLDGKIFHISIGGGSGFDVSPDFTNVTSFDDVLLAIENAINGWFPFELSLNTSSEPTNTGAGTYVAANFPAVTSGGSEIVYTSGSIIVANGDNDLNVTARLPGANLDNLTVDIQTVVTVAKERVEYDVSSNTLILKVIAGTTTAQRVVELANEAAQREDRYGPHATKVSWDVERQRFVIASNALLKVSVTDPGGADSLFDSSLDPRFHLISDIRDLQFHNISTVKPMGSFLEAVDPVLWDKLGNDTEFVLRITTAAGTKGFYINPQFAGVASMADVVNAIQVPIDTLFGAGLPGATVRWDDIAGVFVFTANAPENSISIAARARTDTGKFHLFGGKPHDTPVGFLYHLSSGDYNILNVAKIPVETDPAGGDATAIGLWAGLLDDKEFRLFIGERQFLIIPHFTGVTQMGDASNPDSVAGRLQSAINSADAFGPGSVSVTWDELGKYFLLKSNTLLPIIALDGTGASPSLFGTGNGVLFKPVEILDDIKTLATYFNATSILANSADPSDWVALASSRSFSIMVDGISRNVTPDFTGVGTMEEVALRMQAAINLQYSDTPVTVAYAPGLQRFLLQSTTDNSFSGIAEINGAVDSHIARILRQTLSGLGTDSVTLVLETGQAAAWQALAADTALQMTIGGNTQEATPDFTDAATMDLVAAELQQSLNNVFGVDSISVTYNDNLPRFTITTTGPLAGQNIEGVNDPQNGQTLIGGAYTGLTDNDFIGFVAGLTLNLPTMSVQIQLSSVDGEKWKELGGVRYFDITIGGLTRTINPDFSLMADETMGAAAVVIEAELNRAANFGANRTSVVFNEKLGQFVITSLRPADMVEAVTHPTHVDSTSTMFGPPKVLLNAASQLSIYSYPHIHPGDQGGKHFSMAADPGDPNSLYVAGDRQDTLSGSYSLDSNQVGADNWVGRLYRIQVQPGGANPISQDQLVAKGALIPKNYAQFGNQFDVGTSPHADSRFMTFLPDGTLLEADDGGIFLLKNPTKTDPDPRFWQSLNGNLNVTEFSDVGYDPLQNILTGGAQDVGNQVQVSSNSEEWNTVTSGDGNANDVAYIKDVTNGDITYRYAIGNNLSVISRSAYDANNKLISQKYLSIPKTVIHAEDKAFDGFTDMHLVVNPMNQQRLAIAFGGVYESINNGDTFHDAFRHAPANANFDFDEVTAIAYGTDNEEALYVAAGDKIYVRQNDSAAAGSFTAWGVEPIDGQTIIDIVVDSDDWRIAYILTEKSISFTIDGGVHWTVSLINRTVRNGMLSPAAMFTALELVKLHGADLKITDHTNKSVFVRLTGAQIVADVIAMINRATAIGGLTVSVFFDTTSDTFKFTDTSGGPHPLKIEVVDNSDAAIDLKFGNKEVVAGLDTLESDPLVLFSGGDVDLDTLISDLTNDAGGQGIRLSSLKNDLLILGTNWGIYQVFNPRELIDITAGAPYPVKASSPSTAELHSTTAGRPGTISIQSRIEGSFFNGVQVEFVAGTGPLSVSYDPVMKLLSISIIDGTTTAEQIRDAINNAPVINAHFIASSPAGGLVGEANAYLHGGLEQYLNWIKMGQDIPYAEVTEIQYNDWITSSANKLGGGALVAVTRGRGAWKVDNFTLHNIQERPELIITSSDNAKETISLSINPTQTWMFDVAINGIVRYSDTLSNIYRIVVLGSGGDDILEIDADLFFPGGIVFDAGTGDSSSKVRIYGKSGVHTVLRNEQDAATGNGFMSISRPGKILFIQVANQHLAPEPIMSVNTLDVFREGLASLSGFSEISQTLGRNYLPVIGQSLGNAVVGNPPATDYPIGLPTQNNNETVQQIEALAAQGYSTQDLQGDETILSRILNAGPLGDFLSEIGQKIDDYELLRQTFDDLDDISGNVTYTETADSVTFDLAVMTRFAGGGKIDINALGGLLALEGEVNYAFDVNLHMIIGVDSKGFFIDTEAVVGPELTVSNVDFIGKIEAVGRIGFIEIGLINGLLDIDDLVAISVDFHDPSYDPYTGEVSEKLRLHEFGVNSVFDIFTLEISGNPVADDIVFSGNFGVFASIPGLSEQSYSIVDAGLIFTWADVANPFTLTVDGKPDSPTGQMVADFLSFDFDEYFLQILGGLDTIGDFINDLAPLNTEIPLINRSFNTLFTADPFLFGDLFKLQAPMNDYFTSLRSIGSFPSFSGVFDLVFSQMNSKMPGFGMVGSIIENAGTPELRIDFALNIDPQFEVALDLGAALQSIGFNATGTASVQVAGNVQLFGAIVLDLNSVLDLGVSIADAVFLELENVSVDLGLSVVDLDLGLDLGFLSAAIENASISLNGGVNLTLTDPDKKISLAELTATSFNDLFTIDVDDLVMKLALSSLEVFAGVGRDVAAGRQGTGFLVGAQDVGIVVYGKFGNAPGTGDILPPEWSYAMGGTGFGELLGVPGVTLSGSSTLKLNTTGGAVAETIDIGGSPVDITFAPEDGTSQRIEINGELAIGDFVYLNGDFAYEKSDISADLTDGNPVIDAELFVVSGSNISAFAGGNGPYFTDLDADGEVTPNASDNGDGIIETHESDELNAASVGLWFGGLDFALAMLHESSLDGSTLRSWTALKARADNAALVGIPGVTAQAANLLVELNLAEGENSGTLATPLNWNTALDLDGNGTYGDVLDPGLLFDPPVDLALDFNGSLLHVAGSVNISLAGLPALSGNFDFSKMVIDVDIDGNGTLDATDMDDASLVTFMLSDVEVFIGAAGVGFDVVGGSLMLAQIKSADLADTRSYLAIQANLANTDLLGIPGLTASATNLGLEINRAEDPGDANLAALDWTTALDLNADATFGDTLIVDLFTIDYIDELFQANGNINFALLNFVGGAAEFTFRKRGVDLDIDGNGLLEIDDITDGILFTLALNNVDVFVGVGPIGFTVTGGQMGLALARANEDDALAGDSRSYLAVRGLVGSATLDGIPAITAQAADLEIEINQASGAKSGTDATALNWTTALDLDGDTVFGEVADSDLDGVYETSEDLLDPGLGLNPPLAGQEIAIAFTEELIQIKGFVTLQISEFVYLSGNFAFAKGENISVVPVGSVVSKEVSVLTIGAANGHAFVGIGGPYWQDSNGDGVIDGTDTPLAAGVLGVAVENVGFGLALMNPVDGSAAYYALQATGSASLVGIDALDLTVADLTIEVNKAQDGSSPVDFSLLPGGFMSIPTGPSSPDVELGFDSDVLRARGLVTLNISDFVFVSGAFSFEQGGLVNTTLNDGSSQDVNALQIGAANVHAFVGIGGPYWQDSNGDGVIDGTDTPLSAGALGVALENVGIGLVMMKPVAASSVSYYALKATGSASLVGLGALDLSLQELSLEVNQSSDGSPVVDFTQLVGGLMPVSTGPVTPDVELDFSTELLRGSGFASLTISEFIHVSGAFSFEKGQETPVTLADAGASTANVNVLKIGASHIHAFAGIGGPYWQDSDGDGDIDADDTPLSAGAVGLALEDVEFGLALMQSTAADATSYYAVKGSGAVELVGVPGVDLVATSISFEVNATDHADSTRVVDFGASFPPQGLEVSTGPAVADSVFLDFTEDLLRTSGHVTLTIAGISLETDIFFEKTTTVPVGKDIIKIAASNMMFSLQGGLDDLVSVTGGTGNLIITDQGIAGDLSATVAFNIPNVTIGFATVSVAINNIVDPVNVEFNTPTGTQVLDLPGGPYVRVGATGVSVVVDIGGTPYTLDGGLLDDAILQFEQFTLPDATKVIKVAVAHLAANIPGDGDLTNGWGGFIFYEDGMAGMVKGDVSLFSGTLSGDAALFMNNTNRDIHDVITIVNPDGDTEDLPIDVTANTVGFALTNATLQIGDYFVLEGDYTFQTVDRGLATERNLIGADNVSIFLGRGPPTLPDGSPNPDAIGILVNNAQVGVVMFPDDTYAIEATGDAGIIGLGDGFTISGSLSVKINNSGRAVNETISLPGAGTIPVHFATTERVEFFEGSPTINIGDVFTLDGTIRFTRSPTGMVQVDVPNANVGINIPDGSGGFQSAFGISGSANFSIGGDQGFRLQDIRVNGFSIFGVTASISSPALALRPPSADLGITYNGGVFDAQEINDRGYLEVVYTDVNDVGLNESSITDDAQEFLLVVNGASADSLGITVNGRARKISDNVYQYDVYGTLPDGEIQLRFLPNAWSDTSGINNVTEVEHFSMVTRAGPGDPLPAAAPTAMLSNPFSGALVSLESLNARRYIDATFVVPGGSSLNHATITIDDLTLSGAGLGDAQVSSVSLVSGTTYRFYLTDSDTANDVDLFIDGEVIVDLPAIHWQLLDGTDNAATEVRFTVDGAADDAATSDDDFEIGPLVLAGPSISLVDTSFNEGTLVLTIGVGVDTASLDFGSGADSGITAELTGVVGTFDVEVDIIALLGVIAGGGDILDAFGVGGKFGLRVDSLEIDVPDVVRVNAEGIVINHDANYDPAENGGAPQDLVSIATASLTFERFNVSGTVDQVVVRDNGFSLGSAEIQYGGVDDSGDPITLGDMIEFDDFRIGVTDFDVTYGAAVDFSGEIYIASGGARFFNGRPVSATISDSDDADTEAIRVGLEFESNRVKALRFTVDVFEVQLGSSLTLFGRNIVLDTGAAENEELIHFTTIGAKLTIGSMVVTGEGRNFAFLGDGSFQTLPGFGVFLGVGSATGEGFGWPDWMPIKLTQIGIEWPDIQSDPTDFTITLSATVTSIAGVEGLEFSGTIEGVKIDVGLLLEGKFPVVDFASIGVGVKGDMFGGTIDAQLIGGIVKLDAAGNVISPIDSITPVEERIFFVGVQGGFEFSGMGLNIRFALSELGPLGVFINASIPGGVVIVPQIGLALNDFSAGVEFFTTLPDIDDPFDLRNPAFGLPTDMSPENWLDQVKGQVVNQYLTLKANPGMSGFAAAFTSPMTITGACKIYSIYTSEAVFNGQVMVKFSTDGKILISGTLNFADDNLSISAKLYANLSKITSGEATVLFLADIPDQVDVLTIYGKLQMGFRDANGDPVPIEVANLPSPTPTADLAGPLNGGETGLGTINNRGYVDVSYSLLPGHTLKVDTITDLDPEFTLGGTGLGTLKLDNNQPPVLIDPATNTFRYWTTGTTTSADVTADFIADKWVMIETATGTEVGNTAGSVAGFDATTADAPYFDVKFSPSDGATLTEASIDGDEFNLTGIGANGVTITGAPTRISDDNVYRYYLSGDLAVGEVEVNFIENRWADSSGNNLAETELFTAVEPVANVVAPFNGQSIDVTAINGQLHAGKKYIDVVFQPSAGSTLDYGSIFDAADEFTLTAGEEAIK